MKRGMAETLLGGLVLLVTTIFLIYAVEIIHKSAMFTFSVIFNNFSLKLINKFD